MQRFLIAAFVAATVFWTAGCSENYVPSPPSRAEPQAEAPSSPEPPPSSPAPVLESPSAQLPAPTAVPESKPVEQPASEPPAPVVPPLAPPRTIVTDRHSIELSTGVALAQPGPEGTMMMFSVEYEFVLGEPNPKSGYVWVIERAKGAPVKQAVRLSKKRTLYTAVQRWRPENGPFRSHIEDRDGKRLSASIDML